VGGRRFCGREHVPASSDNRKDSLIKDRKRDDGPVADRLPTPGTPSRMNAWLWGGVEQWGEREGDGDTIVEPGTACKKKVLYEKSLKGGFPNIEIATEKKER